ncbi:DUF1844 domain-containing protein [Silvibacterium acidisoli]|uniref:DUF1844 domain-containing protein n=1 Tax=Acidobacteriaceae bacterium ZG23-2 TaxID=2883246 RepID=UPI00406C643E
MAEKPTPFTVSDRRKFTLDGELRDETAVTTQETTPETKPETKQEQKTTAAESVPAQPSAGPRLVTMAAPAASPEPEPVALDESELAESELAEAELAPAPTAAELAAQRTAYQKASEDLNLALRAANPGMDPATIAPISFDHLVQSLYLSAVVALGAGTEPGQKPRVDILGARQNIDMLMALHDKTGGNLNPQEQRLLDSALFELQAMFAEITKAVTQQQIPKPPQGLK